MKQLSKSLLIDIIHTHLLCLTLDEFAIERCMEEWGVEAYQLFMNDEFLLGRCLGHDDRNELSRFAEGGRWSLRAFTIGR